MYDSGSDPEDKSILGDYGGTEWDGSGERCQGEGDQYCIMTGLPLESTAPLHGAGAAYAGTACARDNRDIIAMGSLATSNVSRVDGRSSSPIWLSHSGESNGTKFNRPPCEAGVNGASFAGAGAECPSTGCTRWVHSLSTALTAGKRPLSALFCSLCGIGECKQCREAAELIFAAREWRCCGSLPRVLCQRCSLPH
ncbi:hypothetical protein UY3_03726 [Chelonia mydas]|uniref:Uncharacterized protein n=1 Tax=Chelonia mydas TaxID=8469 RepID=M7CE35_CHEMY|nr:hypothetical protein UY3_03726 [Chelonia mydas]